MHLLIEIKLPRIQYRHWFLMAASRFFTFCFPLPDLNEWNEHIEPSKCLPLHLTISGVSHSIHSAQKFRIALRLLTFAALKPFLSRIIVLCPFLFSMQFYPLNQVGFPCVVNRLPAGRDIQSWAKKALLLYLAAKDPPLFLSLLFRVFVDPHPYQLIRNSLD